MTRKGKGSPFVSGSQPPRPQDFSQDSPAEVAQARTGDAKGEKGSHGPTAGSWAGWAVQNQAGLSLGLIAVASLTHAWLTQERPYARELMRLLYYNPATGKFAAGFGDLNLIAFCILLFTALRAGAMQYVLAPLATRWGIAKSKEANRFAEQGWILMYYSVFWPWGMYIYVKSPYFLNMRELWTDWPQRELDGGMKVYFLAQGAYWTQQILAVNLEARRKDYWQIMVHHFLTITLIAASYAHHYTRVGNLILVSMDVIELIFPLAKCLKSLGLTTLCDAVFALFAVTWLVTRHGLYLAICWSVYADAPRELPVACYKGPADNLQGPFPVPEGWSHLLEPFRDPAGWICYNDKVWYSFFSYLAFLQVIMSIWSFFLVQVIIKVLRGGNAEDVRSDDEEEEEEEEEESKESIQDKKKAVPESAARQSVSKRKVR